MNAKAEVALNPVTVGIIGAAFASIVEEMGTALIRSAYSTNVKERRDCSTVLFDREARLIAQAEHIPIHLGSLIGLAEQLVRRYPIESIQPGDVFVGNDPYTGGGTHLPDIVLIEPIFVGGSIVAYAANLAHHTGFYDRGHEHIYQEGVRIPLIRLFEAGVLRNDILDFINLNLQVEGERLGDFRAQIAANRVGVRRYQALCGKYGVEVVAAASDELLNYAERQTRHAISQIKDGVYAFEDQFDVDDLADQILTLKVVVTVDGGRIHLDFSDNPLQNRTGLNVLWTALIATVYYAVKSLADPTILANAGMFRAIEVEATPGTIVNCSHPAAVNRRTQICQRLVDVIYGALAPAMPERVTAAHMGSVASFGFAGINPRTGGYYISSETVGGGFGARYAKDGLDGVQTHITNTSNLPIEVLEVEYPLRVDRYELVQDSGGAGRQRGGCGIRRDITILGHDPSHHHSQTRRLTRPWGLDGGLPGAPARVTIDGEQLPLSSKGKARLKSGQVVVTWTAGGGGYGSPLKRSRQAVLADLKDGLISERVAKEIYGLGDEELAALGR